MILTFASIGQEPCAVSIFFHHPLIMKSPQNVWLTEMRISSRLSNMEFQGKKGNSLIAEK